MDTMAMVACNGLSWLGWGWLWYLGVVLVYHLLVLNNMVAMVLTPTGYAW